MQDLKVFQIDTKVFLLRDIRWENLQEKLCSFMDEVMGKVPELLEMHKGKGYKPYTFSCLYPVEKEGIYKSGQVYSFSIRTIDVGLKHFFQESFVNEYNADFKCLTNCVKVIPEHLIEKLYSITAVIVKAEGGGYWRDHVGIQEYQRYLTENLIKKYNYFMGGRLKEDFDFIREIKFLNKGPIASNYKEIKLLGDKFDLYVAENETSQKLAYLALGVGMGNNNTRGSGYVNCKWYRR